MQHYIAISVRSIENLRSWPRRHEEVKCQRRESQSWQTMPGHNVNSDEADGPWTLGLGPTCGSCCRCGRRRPSRRDQSLIDAKYLKNERWPKSQRITILSDRFYMILHDSTSNRLSKASIACRCPCWQSSCKCFLIAEMDMSCLSFCEELSWMQCCSCLQVNQILPLGACGSITSNAQPQSQDMHKISKQCKMMSS